MGSKVSTSQAHTAEPWFVVDKHEYYPKLGKNVVASFDGYEIHTENHLGDNEANARFIVTACNSHQEFLEACKLAKAGIEANIEQLPAHNPLTMANAALMDLLTQVISKSEGRA